MSIGDIIRFLKEDVWRIRLKDLPARKSVLIKNLRIILLAFKGFNEDKCALRAKALTFSCCFWFWCSQGVWYAKGTRRGI